MPRVDLPEVTKWLLQAPKIARDTAPFYWTYLDCPPDGSIFLTWQPTARRSSEFASDGYVWVGPEVSYQQSAGNGLVRAPLPGSGHSPIHSRAWMCGLTGGIGTGDFLPEGRLPNWRAVHRTLQATLPALPPPGAYAQPAPGRPQPLDRPLWAGREAR